MTDHHLGLIFEVTSVIYLLVSFRTQSTDYKFPLLLPTTKVKLGDDGKVRVTTLRAKSLKFSVSDHLIYSGAKDG